jgi:hypothetical protein
LQLFEDLEEMILTRIIVALRSSFLPPDELVVTAGESGTQLYIIRKGVVSVRLICCKLESMIRWYPHVHMLACWGLPFIVETFAALQVIKDGSRIALLLMILQDSNG